MTNEKILYQKFLEDKRSYNLNVGYWKQKLQKALDDKFGNENNYAPNKNIDGRNFYDGNPIYSYYEYSKRKGVRIVQGDPDELRKYSDLKLIEAWTSKIIVNDIQITELVISLYLTRSTVDKSIDLIRQWFSNDTEDFSL